MLMICVLVIKFVFVCLLELLVNIRFLSFGLRD